VLLMTNLAHPMNPRYAAHGLRDEMELIRQVASAFDAMDGHEGPLFWRPHPVIALLPGDEAAVLRAEAQRLGFQEVNDAKGVTRIAFESRWVVTSPSTIAVDLLGEGVLSIVFDIQGTVLDSAIGRFPIASSADSLIGAMRALEGAVAYEDALARTYREVLPAPPFGLGSAAVLTA
jgi:hypothetical protein